MSSARPDADVVPARVDGRELAHAPRFRFDRRGIQVGVREPGMPFVDVGDDDVTPGAVALRVDVLLEAEIEHALLVVVNEHEPVVVSAHYEPGRFVEPDRLVHIDHRQGWRDFEHAGLLGEPADTHTTHPDVVVALQRRGGLHVAGLTAAQCEVSDDSSRLWLEMDGLSIAKERESAQKAKVERGGRH